MRNLILRRLRTSLLIVIAVSIVVFASPLLLPGDPPDQRYFGWVAGLFFGDFGSSTAAGEPVAALLGTSIANSLVLLTATALIAVPVGLWFGIASARRRDTKRKARTTPISPMLTAVPELVVGIVLLALFATSVLRILPAVSPTGTPVWEYPLQVILPLLTLVLVATLYIVRTTNSALFEALGSDSVEMARLKGASDKQVVMRHALPQTIGPVAHAVAMQLTWMISGAIVVEYLFRYPGIGLTLVDAVHSRDVPVVQAIALLVALACVLVHLLAQIIEIVANPRLRSTA